MAKQNRKKAPGKKPVTSHPLFPAVVALWFGALFGLGSLAIRASLLESLVVSAHIDSLVPAAAPPLGMTFRIVLALVLAAIGAVIGAVIAKALARPTSPKAQRSRKVGARRDEVQLRSRDAHPDAPARRPISAHEEFGEDDLDDEEDDWMPARAAQPEAVPAEKVASPLPGRRRSLTVDSDHPQEIHDLAPLPGGDPQILDMSDFAVAEVPTSEAETAAPAAPELDLASFASPVEAPAAPAFAAPSPIPTGEPASFAAPAPMPTAQPAPFAAPAAFAPPAPFAPPAAFAPPAEAPAEPIVDSEEAAAPIALGGPFAALHNRDADWTDPAALPTQAVAAPEPELASVDFARINAMADGDEPAARVFDMPFAAERLFGAPAPAASAPVAESEVAPSSAEPEAVPAASDPGPEPVAVASAESEPVPAHATPTDPADLDALSQVELIERLARSIQRRRETAPAAKAEAPTDAVAAAVPAPVAEAAPQFAPPPVEVPAALPEVAEAPAAPTLPAALRPLNFDEDEDEDDLEALSSLLPPRHIAMPAALAAEPAIEAAEADEDDEDDDGYSSLLDLDFVAPAQRQGFVRIEEAESADGTVEPVVIFPGQSGYGATSHPGYAVNSAFAAPGREGIGGALNAIQPAAPQFAAPQTGATMTTAQAATEAEQRVLRRFDAPGSAGVVGEESSAARPARDPEETERALRAALSTLQRMSGAA